MHLYPAADGALVHLVVDPDLRTQALCGWTARSSKEALRPIHMPRLCASCQKVAEAQGMLSRCVGCMRLVAQPTDHAEGCPTGQNGSPRY